jgi:hypothetical protein
MSSDPVGILTANDLPITYQDPMQWADMDPLYQTLQVWNVMSFALLIRQTSLEWRSSQYAMSPRSLKTSSSTLAAPCMGWRERDSFDQ